MKISACYIIGKKEDVFEKSLESIMQFVDEIIIVHTTEEDREEIKRIGKRFEAETCEFSWCDDFAAAKNYAIEKASGDWILFLDADEYIEIKGGLSLKNMIENAGAQGIEVLQARIFNIDTDRENKLIDAFFAARIFKRDTEIRYKGKIHEDLSKNNGELERAYIDERELKIYHTGYSSNKLQAKGQRNLAILLKEVETVENPADLYMAIAEAYEGTGDKVNAKKYALLDIERGRQEITYASRSYRVLLRVLEADEVFNKEEIKDILQKALKDFPDMPEFHAEYARYLALDYAWEAAVEEMKIALHCFKAYDQMEPTFFDQSAENSGLLMLNEWQERLQKKAQLKISACVIVKNEECEIGRWIENMSAFADELIIVDTGSTDQTVKIVESKGISIYKYIWNDDFSEAKNYAIEKASGDWIVFLDADEYFSPETIENVRAVICDIHCKNDMNAVMCPEVDIDEDKHNIEMDQYLSLRLFKNMPSLRYSGRIHESMQSDAGDLSIYMCTDINLLKICHTGYSEGKVQKKAKRNLDILLKEIQMKGESSRDYRYLMDCYHVLGDHEKAVKYARLHLEAGTDSIGLESHVYVSLINSMIFLKITETDIRRYIKEAMEKFSDIPDFYAFMAGSYLREKSLAKAKEYLLESLRVYKENSGNIINSSHYISMITTVYTNLAEIFRFEGDLARASSYAQLALQENKYNAEAFKEFYNSIKEINIEEQKKSLQKWYGENKNDVLFLKNEMENIEINELYFLYVKKLEKKYGICSFKSNFYTLLNEKSLEQSYEVSLENVSKNTELYVYLVFLNKEESLATNYKQQLPKNFHGCAERFWGRKELLTEQDLKGYKEILGIIAKLHPQSGEIWRTIISMGLDFERQYIPDFVNLLFQNKAFYPIGLFLSTDEPIDYRLENFNLQAAISSYHNRNYSLAETYLEKISLTKTQDTIVQSYRKWIKEKTDDGNNEVQYK